MLVKTNYDQWPGALKLVGQVREVYYRLTLAIRLQYWIAVVRSFEKGPP